jgi:hypothetical protein
LAIENGRLTQARVWLDEQKLDGLIAFNDGQNSFLDSHAVYVFSGVCPLGESAVVLARDGTSTLIVTPSWDGARAASLSHTDVTVATDDLPTELQHILMSLALDNVFRRRVRPADQRGPWRAPAERAGTRPRR